MPILFVCVENMGLRGPIFGTLNKSKFRSLVIFSKQFHWFRISLGAHCQLELILEVCRIWAQRPNFRVILGPQIDHNSGLQSFHQIFSNGFTSFLFYMLIGGILCVFQLCAPISGPRVKVAAELAMISGFLYRKGDLLNYSVIK